MITTTLFLRSELRGKRSRRIHCFCCVFSKHNTQLSTVDKRRKIVRQRKKKVFRVFNFFEKEETRERRENTSFTTREYYYSATTIE